MPKRGAAGEHLIEHAPKRPDVGSLVDDLSTRLLRTHVGGGAEDHALTRPVHCHRRRLREVGHRSFAGHHFCQPEVEDLHSAVWCDLDVRWLEIAVDDPFLVRSIEPVRDLARDGQRLRDREWTPLKSVRQRRALNEFEDETAHTVGFFEVVNHADVG